MAYLCREFNNIISKESYVPSTRIDSKDFKKVGTKTESRDMITSGGGLLLCVQVKLLDDR